MDLDDTGSPLQELWLLRDSRALSPRGTWEQSGFFLGNDTPRIGMQGRVSKGHTSRRSSELDPSVQGGMFGGSKGGECIFVSSRQGRD